MTRNANFLLALVSIAATPAIASANDYGWGLGYGIGVGQLYRSLDFPTENRVPYFASRPPVYYSMPVPRTYGHAPFAYPPYFRTPELPCGTQPIEIVNPYVPSATGDAATKSDSAPAGRRDRTVSAKTPAAPKPLVILNPYCDGAAKADAGPRDVY